MDMNNIIIIDDPLEIGENGNKFDESLLGWRLKEEHVKPIVIFSRLNEVIDEDT
jgi:hypothetical protein